MERQIKMTPDELIEDFIQKIDSWVENSGFVKGEFDKEKVEYILDRDPEEMRALSSDDLFIDIFSLHRYIDSLQAAYNHQKMIADFAETSIMTIVSPKLVPVQGDYTKHDVKYNMAIKEDPLCCKLLKLSILSKARLTEANERIHNIVKLTETMTEIAKKKRFKNE